MLHPFRRPSIYVFLVAALASMSSSLALPSWASAAGTPLVHVEDGKIVQIEYPSDLAELGTLYGENLRGGDGTVIHQGRLVRMRGGSRILPPTSFRFNIAGVGSSVFATRLVTSSDQGTTVVLNRATEPNFDRLVDRFTDGIDQLFATTLWFESAGTGPGTYGSESIWLGSVPGGNGIDLQGFDIDEISVTFDVLEIDSPGSDPNGDGIWTSYNIEANWTFIGRAAPPAPAVPVPSLDDWGGAALTLLLAALGISALRARSI